jgi:hypothetical protein
MWSGATAVCIASGPSLTVEDVALVEEWRRARESGRVVIVCNTSYLIAPWADVMVAQDMGWWQVYGDDAVRRFQGEKLSGCEPPRGLAHAVRRADVSVRSASSLTGGMAIALAAERGASRVVLLGYDCAVKYIAGVRQAHWHAAHPRPLGDAGSVERFDARLTKLARDLARAKPDCKIVNASRETQCTAFERVALEEALA